MINKIVLTNFMAHARTELCLADGLTVLVGPNNIGKSTIALALKILARNTNSNFVMQHDQKECSVSVETSEGHSIEWIKRKSPSYVINGQAKDRLGRGGTPPELDGTLRLAPVEFEDKDFEPHFGDQKSPIFLINRPASQIAQFFSTTSDAEKLVAMQRLHHRNRTESQTQAKLLTAKNESIRLCADALESVPVLEAEWLSLEQEAMSLESLASEISQLEKQIGVYVQLTLEQQIQLQRTVCLKALLPSPSIHPTEHLIAVVATWDATSENEHFAKASWELLEELEVAPKMEDEKPLAILTRSLGMAHLKFAYFDEQRTAQSDLVAPGQWVSTEDLQQAIDGMFSLQMEHARLTEIGEATKLLSVFPPLLPEAALSHAVGQMEQVAKDYGQLSETANLLKSLTVAPVVAETALLSNALRELEITAGLFYKNKDLLEQVKNAVTDLEIDTERWLSTEPTCESCGSRLSAESIRFKLHQHGSTSQ